MGTTFVGIGDPGFWMRDSVLELWLRLLALHIEDPVEPGGYISKIRDQWLMASRGYFSGCVPDGLEEAVLTPKGDKLVRAAIGSLLDRLQKAPPKLSRSVLNLMGFVNIEYTSDVETWRLMEVGKAYLALLDGKIKTSASDTSFMPGSKATPFEYE